MLRKKKNNRLLIFAFLPSIVTVTNIVATEIYYKENKHLIRCSSNDLPFQLEWQFNGFEGAVSTRTH